MESLAGLHHGARGAVSGDRFDRLGPGRRRRGGRLVPAGCLRSRTTHTVTRQNSEEELKLNVGSEDQVASQVVSRKGGVCKQSFTAGVVKLCQSWVMLSGSYVGHLLDQIANHRY